ncbi:methyl-accepting chemotaxis protein [Neomoorella thermoacetica]|uniref:methyl-accepting chemotaxis protein n=1 Tax=Neomoorella thermoacetica TaxID=1525 RepID=UPI000918B698|nr:methyl-accepting chemotaxis protein [Moorella thermoacetica]OIQ53770.1 methyl-accepting chemotaxis protein 4 [Moorella thermoacetica]
MNDGFRAASRLWGTVAVLGGTIVGVLGGWWWPHPLAVTASALMAALAAVAIVLLRTRQELGGLSEKLVSSVEKPGSREPEGDAPLLPRMQQQTKNLEDRLRALTRDYQATASQVFSAVEQMSLASRNAGEAVSAFHQLQKVAETISDLGQELTREVSGNRQSVDKCQEVLQQALSAIDRIRLDSTRVSEEIAGLRRAVSQVDEIVASIGQISQHTRLLSLNAAIEAARAGEHGRGFTIVAGEVKKLSDRTQQAVEQTGLILQEIKEKMEQVVARIQAGQEGIAAGVQETGRVKESIACLEQEVAGISSRVDEAYQEINGYLQQLGAAVEVLDNSFASIQKVGEMLAEVASVVERNASTGDLDGLAGENPPQDEVRMEPVMAALRELSCRPEIQVLDPGSHGMVLREWLAKRPDVEAVYSNRSDGTFIFSQPPAALANARIRPWWQRAMAGEEYISTVYVSAITRQPCRTLSLPIRDGSGRIVGVLAADVSLA